jgi:hypothetical protein
MYHKRIQIIKLRTVESLLYCPKFSLSWIRFSISLDHTQLIPKMVTAEDISAVNTLSLKSIFDILAISNARKFDKEVMKVIMRFEMI